MTDLLISRTPGVVEVTFNRPEKHNAFTREMYLELRALFRSLAEDREVKVVVLKGAGGKAFAAGNDIEDFLAQDQVPYEAEIRTMAAMGTDAMIVANVASPIVGYNAHAGTSE